MALSEEEVGTEGKQGNEGGRWLWDNLYERGGALCFVFDSQLVSLFRTRS